MNLTPKIKPKKGVNKNIIQLPFPIGDGVEVKGVFTGLSVEVHCPADIAKIYNSGCYGKGSKSRGAPVQAKKGELAENNECLTLELEEACFLSYFLKILSLEDIEGAAIEWGEFINSALLINSNFLECLAAYLYLKAKGWIVKGGIKFGGQFVIYKKGPRFNHASFIIIVCPATNDDQYIKTIDLKGIQRIAETSDKDVLLLEVSSTANTTRLDPYLDMMQFTVSETIVRRFNSASFVQNKTLTK